MPATVRRCFRLPCAAGERRRRPAAARRRDPGRRARRRRGGIEVLLLAPRRARRPQQRRLGVPGRHRRHGATAHAHALRAPASTTRRRAAGSASPQGGLDYYVAAVRECFEESGLLFAARPTAALVDLDGSDAARLAAVARRAASRRAHAGRALRRARACSLAVDRLVYLSHWLTPLGRPKRFDTRFFVAEAPPAQVAAHDGTELVEQRWLRPADALARERDAEAADADAEDAASRWRASPTSPS